MAKHEGAKAPDEDSDDLGFPPEIMLAVARSHMRWQAAKYAIIGFFVALSLLALWPVTREVAGQETVVNVQIAIGLTVTFAITTGAAAALGNQQRRKANDARSRVGKLEAQIDTLTSENASLNERCDGLLSDLGSLRSDRAERAERPRHGKRG